MKTLIVEDDFLSRLTLLELLKSSGPTQVAVNGQEAVDAVRKGLEENDPFDLICLDIMMPEMDGQQALKEIRQLEKTHGIPEERGAKVLIVTALADRNMVIQAFREQCDGYLVKPIDRAKLMDYLELFEKIDRTHP